MVFVGEEDEGEDEGVVLVCFLVEEKVGDEDDDEELILESAFFSGDVIHCF